MGTPVVILPRAKCEYTRSGKHMMRFVTRRRTWLEGRSFVVRLFRCQSCNRPGAMEVW